MIPNNPFEDVKVFVELIRANYYDTTGKRYSKDDLVLIMDWVEKAMVKSTLLDLLAIGSVMIEWNEKEQDFYFTSVPDAFSKVAETGFDMESNSTLFEDLVKDEEDD